ncbi:hypothetical protein DRW07_01785 [Alteromonas sediminis]|uniref:Uncharacterized protein n=1 Tax=Alteromonas sediminis TaxID=2259342 RepID=A0A3N5ZAJ9_9ALTE|nr:hypothetical protein [Alteromonas sediminis]RPJ68164.1 hypothetical protein DRW07_01785 [Alteromonas sediminis]
MSLPTLKIFISTFVSSLIAALVLISSTTQADVHSVHLSKIKGNGLTIRHNDTDHPTYYINGTKYEWDELSEEQQAKLSVIHEEMAIEEAKLHKFEETMAPVLKEIESRSHEIAIVMEEMKPELEALENIENLTLKDIRLKAEKVEEKVRLHEKELRTSELALRENEALIKKIEKDVLGDTQKISAAIEKHAAKIVEIVTER